MPVTPPPTITALPTPPDPNDRSTFNARAYPWSVAQQTLATEVGAVATNVFNNATDAAASASAAGGHATTAASASNFKGEWASLTGALAVPASVAHGGQQWTLLAAVADVTAHTPGVSASWQSLGISATGAATLTNKTLGSGTVFSSDALARIQAAALCF